MRKLINYRYTKIGGMHFFRIGRFCFSFCVTTKPFDPISPTQQDLDEQNYWKDWNENYKPTMESRQYWAGMPRPQTVATTAFCDMLDLPHCDNMAIWDDKHVKDDYLQRD